VASGKRDGTRLVIIFPYAEGLFRDTFEFVPTSSGWSLLLESQNGPNAWSTFATYALRHASTLEVPRAQPK